MIGLAELMEPTFSWETIEKALLAIPQARWEAAARIGCCTDEAARMIRAVTSDDLRRELERIAGRPLIVIPPQCPCACCADARARVAHGRTSDGACICAGYSADEQCDCSFCRDALAANNPARCHPSAPPADS